MTDDSYIKTGDGYATFVGEDAMRLFRVTVLRSAINIYLETGWKVNRAYTPTAMRDAATTVTGKAYLRNRRGMVKAAADLTTWIEAMETALPIIRE